MGKLLKVTEFKYIVSQTVRDSNSFAMCTVQVRQLR